MTVAQRTTLRDHVLAFLGKQSAPVSVPDIELALRIEKVPADTFDVRDTVDDLARAGQVEFVAGRDVQLVRS